MSVYRKNVVFKLLLGVGVTLCLVGMDTGEIDPVFFDSHLASGQNCTRPRNVPGLKFGNVCFESISLYIVLPDFSQKELYALVAQTHMPSMDPCPDGELHVTSRPVCPNARLECQFHTFAWQISDQDLVLSSDGWHQ